MVDLDDLIAIYPIVVPDWLDTAFEIYPLLDDGLVAGFLLTMLVVSMIGSRVSRRRREAWASTIARETLQTIIDITGPHGANRVAGRWHSRSRRLEIVLTFAEGSVKMTGKLGVDAASVAWAFLDHRPLGDRDEREDPADDFIDKASPAPSSTERSWWDVLGVPEGATDQEVTIAYRMKAMQAHPDRGGTDELMAEVNAAKDDWKAARG